MAADFEASLGAFVGKLVLRLDQVA